jgi:hypothetical protein
VAYLKQQVKPRGKFVPAQFHQEIFKEAQNEEYSSFKRIPAKVASVKSTLDRALRKKFEERKPLPELYYQILEKLYGIERNEVKTQSTSGQINLLAPCRRHTVEDALVSDFLTGTGFGQWRGDQEQWRATVKNAKNRLRSYPGDLFCRAMLVWSILWRGRPYEMLEALTQTGRWLLLDSASVSEDQERKIFAELRGALQAKVIDLANNSVDYDDFARRHLEDSVVRATFLRQLTERPRTDVALIEGRTAYLRRAIEKALDVKTLFDSSTGKQDEGWLSLALRRAKGWADLAQESGWARLCWIWLAGRQRDGGEMRILLESVVAWLDTKEGSALSVNQGHPMARWAAIWLAGLCSHGEPAIPPLIEQSAKWLDRTEAEHETWVRHGFLWLVGDRGTDVQVAYAMAQTDKWLAKHSDDGFIRIAYLLFLVARRATAGQLRKEIATTRSWSKNRPDRFGFTEFALQLALSRLPPSA